MRYYKDENFLIIGVNRDDGKMSLQDICTIGFNLLAELEEEVSIRSCACINGENEIYAIFPKFPRSLTDGVINTLIRKLQQEGTEFEKEDVDCSIVRLQSPVSMGSMGSGSSFEESLRDLFRMIAGRDSDGFDDLGQDEVEAGTGVDAAVPQEAGGHPVYKVCNSVEAALGAAKQLRLEDFSVIGYNKRVYLLTTNCLNPEEAKFHRFIRNHLREAFLKEHGMCYYEDYNYRELEHLQLLDAVSFE